PVPIGPGPSGGNAMILRQHRVPIIVTAVAMALVFAGMTFQRSAQLSEAVAQPPAKAPSADEQAIRQASADYVAAMVAGNLDRVMAFWAPDADYIDEAGKTTRGRDHIAALFKKALPDLKGSKIKGTLQSLKFLRPEVALQDGTLEITSATGTKDSSRHAVIWTKVGDKWLIDSARDLPSQITDLPSLASAQLKDLE